MNLSAPPELAYAPLPVWIIENAVTLDMVFAGWQTAPGVLENFICQKLVQNEDKATVLSNINRVI